MRASFLISPALVLASSWICHAGETSFSEGLKRLAALGLPPMQGAQWVKAPGDFRNGFTDSYHFQEMSVKLSGNVWKLPGDPHIHLDFGSPAEVDLPGSGEPQKDTADEQKPGLLGKMLRNYQEKNPEPKKKTKTPAEPPQSLAAKDAAKLANALGKASVAQEINQRMRWGDANLHGRIMLFAAQLHAAGETESANNLAAALFKAIDNDPAIIDGAISHLADTQYTASANAFFETTDWEAYHTAIKTLLEKYPRGWANAPAVALLSSHLEKRAATPAPLSLPGITLKPEALALIDKLLEKQSVETSDEALANARGIDLSRYPARQRAEMISWLRENAAEGVSFSDPSLWLLNFSVAGETPTSPVEALKAMGMDGFIALVAALTDETLVPIRKQDDGNSYYSSDEAPATAIRRRYASLNRPVTRGEIAAALISSSLPTLENESFGNNSQPDPADLAESAIGFWKTNKDKSPFDLASLYIAEGNPNQRTLAARFLASAKDPIAHAAFEKTVLSAADPLSLISEVDGYLSARKSAAKSFANAYIKLVRENPPSEEDLNRTSAGWQIREAGGLDNYLRKLSLKVGDVSLHKMIAEALRAKKETAEDEALSPIASLAPAIQSIPLHECLTAFGKTAAAASPSQWMEIHQLLLGRIYYETRNNGGEEGVDSETLPEEILEIWKPHIARTDALPAEGDFPKFARAYGAETNGDASALLVELASKPMLAYTLNQYALAEGSPEAVINFVRKRVAAWSSGEKTEPWPSSESVSEERVEEISKKISTLKADEIIPFAMSLPLSERFAIVDIVIGFDEEESLPEGLKELRNTLVSLKPVFDQDHDAEAAAKLGLAVGDKITPELLTKISDALLLDAANTSTTAVVLFSAPLNLGTSLYVTSAKDLDPTKLKNNAIEFTARRFEEHGNPEALSVISVANGADTRLLKDGKTLTLETESSGLNALEEALQSKSPILPRVHIVVLTRADAEKIINQDQ